MESQESPVEDIVPCKVVNRNEIAPDASAERVQEPHEEERGRKWSDSNRCQENSTGPTAGTRAWLKGVLSVVSSGRRGFV